VVAVDVGGTDIKAARIAGANDSAVEVLARRRLPTPRGADGTATAEAVVSAIADLVTGFTTKGPVDAVGVVVPGVVHNGIGVFSANLGWRDFPFAAAISQAVGLPVAFGHDVGSGGIAEHLLGAAQAYRDVVVMPIGTGIAAAILLDGRLHTGSGYAGEVGHIDVGHPDPCGCGQTGCLEARASSAAIARRYGERAGQAVAGAAEVAELVRAGDPLAMAVWQEAVTALAKGIVTMTTLLGVEAVVLGGGLAMAGDLLLDPLRAAVTDLLTFQREPELRIAELGDEAGCLGAGLLAMELVGGGRR
jgi:glucokinase